MNLERFQDALEAYKNTLSNEGPSAEVYVCIGAAYEKLEECEYAIKYYRKASKNRSIL